MENERSRKASVTTTPASRLAASVEMSDTMADTSKSTGCKGCANKAICGRNLRDETDQNQAPLRRLIGPKTGHFTHRTGHAPLGTASGRPIFQGDTPSGQSSALRRSLTLGKPHDVSIHNFRGLADRSARIPGDLFARVLRRKVMGP